MNKEQSMMILVDLIRIKYVCACHFYQDYPDVVIAYRT